MTHSDQLPRLIIVLVLSVALHGIVLTYRLGQGELFEASAHRAVPRIDLIRHLPTINVAQPTSSSVSQAPEHHSSLVNELDDLSFEHTNGSKSVPPILTVASDALDHAIDFDIPPELPEDFPENNAANFTLTLLVGRNGEVLWLFTENSDLPAESVIRVENAVRNARFKIPTHRGLPVITVVRMELQIAPSD